MTQSPQTNAKGFSKAFWVSNTVELFERMAYTALKQFIMNMEAYGTMVLQAVYLRTVTA